MTKVVAPYTIRVRAPQQQSGFPLWRQGGKIKDKVYWIAGTAGMPGNMAGPFGGSPVTGGIGKSSADIDGWCGFACDFENSVLHGVANGGDKQQWSNKAFSVDLRADAPLFMQTFAGTDEHTAVVLTPGNDARYVDGLLKARQSYFNNHFIPPIGGVIMIGEAAQFCNATTPGSAHYIDAMDFFNTSTNQYAPANTYPTNGVASGLTAGLVHAVAKHPLTHDIYVSDDAQMKKWSPWTGNWSLFANSSGGSWRGAVIDAKRNRWVWCAAGMLLFRDLATATQTEIYRTEPGFVSDSSGDYLALIHDTDNDRYLLFCGDTATGKPGCIYQINPDTGTNSKIADIPAPVNGWNTRVHHFPKLHAVVGLGNYASDFLFMPTT